MEMEHKNYASQGLGGTALGLGAGGLALGVINGAVELLQGWQSGNRSGCSEDHCVNRYEAAQAARIAELETEVKLRDANTYTLGEVGKLRDYMERKFDAVNAQLCQQSVINAQITANIGCMQGQIATLMGLTKTVIPIGNVCPSPMPEFNSWTAPTTTTA